MLDDDDRVYATILPFHSLAEAAVIGEIAKRVIDDPQMVRTIALPQLNSGGCPAPERLVERIVSRAETIKATMQAVF